MKLTQITNGCDVPMWYWIDELGALNQSHEHDGAVKLEPGQSLGEPPPKTWRSRLTGAWDAMREELERRPDLRAPTAEEMAQELAAPRWKPNPISADIIVEPKPSGWFYERWMSARDEAFAADKQKRVVWFGIDFAKGFKPIWEPTEDDRAVHRAITAMQRPTRANEL